MSIDFSDPDEDTIHSPHALAYDLDLPFRILRALSPPLPSVFCRMSHFLCMHIFAENGYSAIDLSLFASLAFG